MIANLGNVSLAFGIFSLCVGLPALAAIPVGIIAWVLANNDLEAMQNGYLDAHGRKDTEMGRERHHRSGVRLPVWQRLAAVVVLSRLRR